VEFQRAVEMMSTSSLDKIRQAKFHLHQENLKHLFDVLVRLYAFGIGAAEPTSIAKDMIFRPKV
jgi:hypothetical protein